ncbi:MAG: universal stress protein [Nocardioides sp.]|nr:universal stress protein [Nocardioides sp.]
MSTSDSRPVSVAVHFAHPSGAAVSWAAEEASGSGVPLQLVTACEPMLTGEAAYAADQPTIPRRETAEEQLGAMATELGDLGVPVQQHIKVGTPIQVLLHAADESRMLVVGQRGIGFLRRIFVGSTSLAVAGRAASPVVVVPNQWERVKDSDGHVLVGVDLHIDDLRSLTEDEHRVPRLEHATAALDTAFAQADRRGVPVVVLSTWAPHPEMGLDAEGITKHEEDRSRRIEAFLAPWIERHPGVEHSVDVRIGRASDLLPDQSAHAGLLVVGRDTKPYRLNGFTLGSSTRALLHHARCPVIVVPAPTALPEPPAEAQAEAHAEAEQQDREERV